jgi:hypothetical protein
MLLARRRRCFVPMPVFSKPGLGEHQSKKKQTAAQAYLPELLFKNITELALLK